MFFLHEMERPITLHPSCLGPHIHQLLHRQLLSDVEGTINGNFYIVTVLDKIDISEGRVMPGTGWAEYKIAYKAIVWRPFRGEVVRHISITTCDPRDANFKQLDGIVNSVISNGCFVDVGPLTAFISKHVRRLLALKHS